MISSVPHDFKGVPEHVQICELDGRHHSCTYQQNSDKIVTKLILEIANICDCF